MEIIALTLAFILWKVFMVLIGTVLTLFPAAIIFGLTYAFFGEWGAYETFIKGPSAKVKKIMWVIIVFVSIPYNYTMWTSIMGTDISGKFSQGWTAYYTKETAKKATKINMKTEIRRFTLEDWNPPKHFYVDLRDVKSGLLYENVYVSKHCNNHTKLKRGEEYNVQITTYEWSNNPGLIEWNFQDLYMTFCSE